LGGSIKNDEAGIKFRLAGVLPAIVAYFNVLFNSHHINLPQFTLIDYTLAFDYQDSALGVGLNVLRK
jgi:hypothetical protein